MFFKITFLVTPFALARSHLTSNGRDSDAPVQTPQNVTISSYCNSCVGQEQYSTCGDLGLYGQSFCSYDYLYNAICLQNQYCSEITTPCSTHANCGSGQACAYAACSSSSYCYTRCEIANSPTPMPSRLPTKLPTHVPTKVPTPAPSRKPTARPIAPGSYCSACVEQEQYAQCGNRGLHDFSFCSYDYLDNWICLQNGYCIDYTHLCSTHADCPDYQACAFAGCSAQALCYDKCDGANSSPTAKPTALPTAKPTTPSANPIPQPTAKPSTPSANPTPQPTAKPTATPTHQPTLMPISTDTCVSCEDKVQYSQCGNRGLNDFSFCTYDYLGNPICLRDGYCVDHTQFCDADSDCPAHQACAIAGCSGDNICYDRCDYDLVATPTAQPTLTNSQSTNVKSSQDDDCNHYFCTHDGSIVMIILIIIAGVVLLVVVACVWKGASKSCNKPDVAEAEAPSPQSGQSLPHRVEVM